MKQSHSNGTRPSARAIRRSLLVTVSIALVMAMARCPKTSVEAYEPQLNIFAVLWNDGAFQEITIDRTYSLDESTKPYIDDALVVLEGDALTDTCPFNYYHGHYHSLRKFPINAGSTYRISAIKDGCDTLMGETTVPGGFIIINPAENDSVTLDDTIVMTTGRGTALYSVRAEFSPAIHSVLWFRSNRPDSLVSIPINYLITDTSWNAFAVEVTAFDPNFYRYHYELTDSVMRAGVTGGVGLFGSAYEKRVLVYLKPVTEGRSPVAILK